MATIKQLKETIDQEEGLKLISQAYTEIASIRLKKIRQAVEKNRYFLEDLAQVYKVVKRKALENKIILPKNNKTVCILITSNYHFYGSVNNDLIEFFLENTRKNATDQIIIGKTALQYLQSISYKTPFKSYTLKKDYPSLNELTYLVEQIKDYSQILVFYSKMKSVLIQAPTISDVTQSSEVKLEEVEDKSHPNLFIFEPELEKILGFFDAQVTNLLLQQTFLDSEVSRTASRLVSMDLAQNNADKYILEQKSQLELLQKTFNNSKLLTTYAAQIALGVNHE